MLLLKRRVGESIVIGDSIRVSVVEVRGGGVRLAIDAPSEMPVYRAELLERLGEENSRARRSKAPESSQLADHQIHFPLGILGMGAHTAYVLYDVDDNYRALVARDDPTLALLLVDPLMVDPEYPIDRVLARFPADPQELAVAVVVTRSHEGVPATANLAAPIVIDLQTSRAAQLLLDDESLPLRAPIQQETVEVRAP
jgi:carbon storage regulator